MTKTTTNKSRQKKRAVISILLIVAILIGGAFAFLTAQDSKTNVFTIGKVSIRLDEKFDKNLNGEIGEGETFDATNNATPQADNIIPGQNIIKQPYVVNTGDNPAYIFMAVGIPVADSLDSIDSTLQIPVKAFAMQKGYEDKDNAPDIWTAFSTKTAKIFGTEADNSQKTELFNLYHLDNSDNYVAGVNTNQWDFVQTYQVSGFNYYVYAYKALLSNAADQKVTTNLFDSVRLVDGVTGTGNNSMVDDNENLNLTAIPVDEVAFYKRTDRSYDGTKDVFSYDIWGKDEATAKNMVLEALTVSKNADGTVTVSCVNCGSNYTPADAADESSWECTNCNAKYSLSDVESSGIYILSYRGTLSETDDIEDETFAIHEGYPCYYSSESVESPVWVVDNDIIEVSGFNNTSILYRPVISESSYAELVAAYEAVHGSSSK